MNSKNTFITINTKKRTTQEMAAEAIVGLEKQFNTGPIIGEAREVIENLLYNLNVKDVIIASLGMPEEAKKIFTAKVSEYLQEQDQKILKEREVENAKRKQ